MKILVYGTLKKGFYNHDLLSKSKMVDKGYFFIKNTSLRANSDFSFPYLFFSKNQETNFFYGEVYEIDQDTLDKLDFLEGHPDFYERVFIRKLNMFVYVSKDESLKDIDCINNFSNEVVNLKENELSYLSYLSSYLIDFKFNIIKGKVDICGENEKIK